MIKTAAARKITLWSNFLNLWFLFFVFLCLIFGMGIKKTKQTKQLYWKNFQDSIGHGLSLIFLLCIFFVRLRLFVPIFWAYCSTIMSLSAKTKKRFLRRNKTTTTTTTLCPVPLFSSCYASSVWDGYYATTTRTKVTNENDFNWGCSAVCNNIGLNWWELHFRLRIVFVCLLFNCVGFSTQTIKKIVKLVVWTLQVCLFPNESLSGGKFVIQ